MSDDWKTIRVPPTVHQDAKELKEEYDDTWGSVVNYYVDHRGGDDSSPEITVTTEEMRPMIRQEIADAMSEVTIDVTIDADEAGDLNEEDVRNIVESKLDALKRELR